MRQGVGGRENDKLTAPPAFYANYGTDNTFSRSSRHLRIGPREAPPRTAQLSNLLLRLLFLLLVILSPAPPIL